MVDRPRDPNELGALWIKTGGGGEYMTGNILGQPVVVFRNDRKAAGSNAPDWRVMKPKARTLRTEPVAPTLPALDDEDIPF